MQSLHLFPDKPAPKFVCWARWKGTKCQLQDQCTCFEVHQEKRNFYWENICEISICITISYRNGRKLKQSLMLCLFCDAQETLSMTYLRGIYPRQRWVRNLHCCCGSLNTCLIIGSILCVQSKEFNLFPLYNHVKKMMLKTESITISLFPLERSSYEQCDKNLYQSPDEYGVPTTIYCSKQNENNEWLLLFIYFKRDKNSWNQNMGKREN